MKDGTDVAVEAMQDYPADVGTERRLDLCYCWDGGNTLKGLLRKRKRNLALQAEATIIR